MLKDKITVDQARGTMENLEFMLNNESPARLEALGSYQGKATTLCAYVAIVEKTIKHKTLDPFHTIFEEPVYVTYVFTFDVRSGKMKDLMKFSGNFRNKGFSYTNKRYEWQFVNGHARGVTGRVPRKRQMVQKKVDLAYSILEKAKSTSSSKMNAAHASFPVKDFHRFYHSTCNALLDAR